MKFQIPICKLVAVIIAAVIPATVTAQGALSQIFDGVYVSESGEQLTISSFGKDQYKLSSKGEPQNIDWEGNGYFAAKCKCIRAVMRFTTRTDQYWGIGAIDLEVREPGNALILRGGWNGFDGKDFHRSTYIRKPN